MTRVENILHQCVIVQKQFLIVNILFLDVRSKITLHNLKKILFSNITCLIQYKYYKPYFKLQENCSVSMIKQLQNK